MRLMRCMSVGTIWTYSMRYFLMSRTMVSASSLAGMTSVLPQ